MRRFLATIALICGLTALLGSSAYHVASRPEWTQAQALRQQWPILLAGVLLVALGCRLLHR